MDEGLAALADELPDPLGVELELAPSELADFAAESLPEPAAGAFAEPASDLAVFALLAAALLSFL